MISSSASEGPELTLTFEERPGSVGRVYDVRLAVHEVRLLAALKHRTFGTIEVASAPAEFFKQHLAAIGRAPVDPTAEGVFAERLAAAGAFFGSQVLPADVRRCLAALRDGASHLHVISDAPWVPWELLRIESRPESRSIDGPFLAEAFALTRGLPGLDLARELPLTHLGVVVADAPGLANLEGEWHDLEELAILGARAVTRIAARLEPLLLALRSGDFDGWHVAAHGRFDVTTPDLSGITLEGDEVLTATLIDGVGEAFGVRHPLVFFNTCGAGQAGMSLSAVGGWAARLLRAGAGAFIGPIWPVNDARARIFARTLYRELVSGSFVGEAARTARSAIATPADPTGLSYAVFAHPAAVCAPSARNAKGGKVVAVGPGRNDEPLHCDLPQWDASKPPGALLRADYGIVRFHGRERELADLEQWCVGGPSVAVRLYTGQGGMGKTRLALEMARRLHVAGWQAGFLNPAMSPLDVWRILHQRGGRMFIVIDYAETRRKQLVPLLQEIEEETGGPIRIVLLARAALDWWEQLKREGNGVGELLSGAATSKQALGALALTVPQRHESFGFALADFSRALGQVLPAATLTDPEADYFERALLLHMSALAAIGRVEAKGDRGILDFVLDREQRHWQRSAEAAHLDPVLVPGIGRLMAAITLAGGVAGLHQAVSVMKAMPFFADQPYAVLEAVARLLRQSYPDPKRGIEPILPDLLGEHLVERELTAGAEGLLTLVLGPRQPDPPVAV